MRVGNTSKQVITKARSASRTTRGVTLGVAAAALLAACSSSGGNAGGAKGSGSAHPGFYKGKTITYIVSNAPGSPPAEQVVALAPYMEKYLGASIHIQYNSGNTIIGQNQVAHAKPDGLTIGEGSLQTDLSQLYFAGEKVDFSLQDISYVGATHQDQEMLVACAGSKYTSMEQLISTKDTVSAVVVTSSPIEELQRLLFAAWGVKGKYLTGYTASTQKAGCQRGDGAVSSGGVSRFLNADSTAMAPRETPLLLSGKVPDNSPTAFLNSKVPTLAEFVKQHPPTGPVGRQAADELVAEFDPSKPRLTTFGPAGIPQDRLDELAAAIQYAGKQPEVQKAFIKIGLPVGIVPPAQIKQFVASALKNVPVVKKLLASS